MTEKTGQRIKKPYGEFYLGYKVPDQFRPVEELLITHESQLLHQARQGIIGLFIYADCQHPYTPDSIKQSLAYAENPYLVGGESPFSKEPKLWPLLKDQLGQLPEGANILKIIHELRPDLEHGGTVLK